MVIHHFPQPHDLRQTINAAVVFVRSIDEFNRDGLAAPLIAVSAALMDLDKGAQHPSLRPETTVGRRPATMERQALRAASAATMDLAVQAGMSPKQLLSSGGRRM